MIRVVEHGTRLKNMCIVRGKVLKPLRRSYRNLKVRHMALLGNAVLAVWNEVDPDTEDDFNEWYLREHIPERTMVPGLNRGRRYRAEQGTPRYMAFYEATTLDVLTHGAYRLQLDNPTAWTRRIMPRFRFMQRGLCDVAASVGEGMGGAAAVMHLTPGDAPRLRTWITETFLHEIHALPDVAAAYPDPRPGEPRSPTTALSQRGTRPIAWVVVVETMEVAGAIAITDAIVGATPRHGAADVRAYPGYRLLYAPATGADRIKPRQSRRNRTLLRAATGRRASSPARIAGGHALRRNPPCQTACPTTAAPPP